MNESTETFRKPRFLHLDLLRGIAALTVATGHLWGWNGRSTIDYTMCVAFFFILSGCVLSHAYYLWHWPLLQLLHPSSPVEISLFFVLLIFLAALGFVFFERPAREVLKAKFRRPSLQLSAR